MTTTTTTEIESYFVSIKTKNSMGGMVSNSLYTPTELSDLDESTLDIINNPKRYNNKEVEITAFDFAGKLIRDEEGIIKKF